MYGLMTLSRGTMAPRIHVPTGETMYEASIEGLTRLDSQILDAMPELPPMYEAAVKYRKEQKDTWRNALEVAGSGWGDCEDLSAWRAAELRVSGEDPDAYVHVYRSGPKRYHAVVARGDGSIEDPSYYLGMKVPPGWRPISHVGERRYTP